MNDPLNNDWSSIKQEWNAMDIEMPSATALRLNLKLRMVGTWVWHGLEIFTYLLMGVLAGLQLAMGNEGFAASLAGLTAVCALASFWASRSPLRSAKGSVRDLLDATVARAKRSKRFAWANYFMVLATAAYVLGLYFSDFGAPTDAHRDLGRVTVVMVVLAVYAAGTGVYHAYARRRFQRYTALQAHLSKNTQESV